MTPHELRMKQQSEPIGPHRQNTTVPTTLPGLSIVNCRETEIIHITELLDGQIILTNRSQI